ncbi:MAG: AAA family ATPase, partial [Oscillospiraceae bacterium]|nr:AAA family ATPase [Oscillospiraceae bacterium]
MCKDGRIPGAYKEGGTWYIPADAERPTDGRVRTGAYKKVSSKIKLPLPVGISDYRVASTEYYYVDKTLMIKDFLDERPQVALFTRPRRFGKTLNMDMLRTFFEKTDEDTSVYFRDKAIWKQGEKYRAYQGKYPVIFLSFKDVKCETWQETLQKLAEIIGSEFARHTELLTTEACNDVDKASFRRIMERAASDVELSSALLTLTRMLHEHHKIAPIIIIDEYDTPIQQGHTRDFYDQVILFMRNLFSGGLKDNSHLTFGFLTGILRVAKESIFSGLNNLSVYSIMDNNFSQYFGFTHDEVKHMAAYYGAAGNYSELCEWYDGYRFGESDIFNPWSVINYFQRKCKLQAYWVSTSSNDVIGEVLAVTSPELYEELYALLRGETITTYIDTGVV